MLKEKNQSKNWLTCTHVQHLTMAVIVVVVVVVEVAVVAQTVVAVIDR